MIVFRQDQIDAFQLRADADLERNLKARLLAAYPHIVQWHGNDAVSALVQRALVAARVMGCEDEQDLLRYIEVSALLGFGFAGDPQFGWVARCVAQCAAEPRGSKLSSLFENAVDYARRVYGGDFRHQIAAFRAFEACTMESLVLEAGRSSRDLRDQIERIFPQKASELGDAGLQDLARVALDACQSRQMATREGVIVMTVLMFVFGTGVFQDPLTGWAADAVEGTFGVERTESRLRQLFLSAVEAASRVR